MLFAGEDTACILPNIVHPDKFGVNGFGSFWRDKIFRVLSQRSTISKNVKIITRLTRMQDKFHSCGKKTLIGNIHSALALNIWA